jgi:hypothetical protein
MRILMSDGDRGFAQFGARQHDRGDSFLGDVEGSRRSRSPTTARKTGPSIAPAPTKCAPIALSAAATRTGTYWPCTVTEAIEAILLLIVPHKVSLAR